MVHVVVGRGIASGLVLKEGTALLGSDGWLRRSGTVQSENAVELKRGLDCLAKCRSQLLVPVKKNTSEN